MIPPLKQILVVEDEPDLQTVIKLVLEQMGGFIVETCNSGEEAIKKAPAFNPDLILLDMLMPGMDGLTTYQALRCIPLTASIPIIFLTAMIQPEEIKRYKELGAIEVIYKPFNPLTLCSTISQIWSQYHHV